MFWNKNKFRGLPGYGIIKNLKPNKTMKKVACSGTSGSGKTTLVLKIAEKYGLTHISGSAGDIKEEGDKLLLSEVMGYPGGGHAGVIKYSALNPEYGIINQKLLLTRRAAMIKNNDNFITDRSLADNMTYFINQCGFHTCLTDAACELFFKEALEAWQELTHVIYIKPVQPSAIEVNHSRVSNKFYQKAIDCQFEYWINQLDKASDDGPKILTIDWWDMDARLHAVDEFFKLNP